MTKLMVVSFVGSILVSAAPARATVIIASDLGRLSRDASAIARGRVVAVEPRWTDDHHAIETLVTLEVDAYLKGALGPTVQFVVPGGTLGRFRSLLVGAPEFRPDQRVIIFLGVQGPRIPFVLGLNQGVFRMVLASDGASWLVTPPPVMPAVEPPAPVTRGDPARRPLALDDFEARVRALAAGAPLAAGVR